MSNIDKQALRDIAEKTKIAGEAPVMPFEQRINALNDFMKHFTPATALALLDELEALQSFRTAFNEWHDKTEWVQGDKRFDVIKPWGKHRADVLKLYIDHLESKLEAKEEQRANWFQMAQKLGEDLDAAEKRIAELEARAFNPAILDVIAERQRQQSVEGWTPEHDDLHDSGELAGAAACYAHYTNARGWVFPTNPGDYQSADEPNNWPWDPAWWKPTNPRRDLVKAGALILAEIERIDRAAGINMEAE
ncbi:ead/Ea22-like family protein [Citrobacter sp. CK202]|jgi:hypothetical protein|uniref:ead/Ea22-like family protein n=1 Tax=Citrobacter sp. CK202 TaxID=2985111 RepID=UPI0025755F32|nr:ead/Ea22-like family protein [Citrobacter sp. CK202]MDM2958767.1 ead/Ea22-like family protein [Citrobacter sp. CK202]